MGKKKHAAAEAQPEQQPQGTGRTPPVHECRVGRIRGVVWRNEGKEGVWFSVNLTRSYRDNSDPPQWKQSTSLGRDDLLVAAEVLRLCWLWIASQNGTNVNTGPNEPQQPTEDPIPI